MAPIEVVAVAGTSIGLTALALFWYTTTEGGKRFFGILERRLLEQAKKKKTDHRNRRI